MSKIAYSNIIRKIKFDDEVYSIPLQTLEQPETLEENLLSPEAESEIENNAEVFQEQTLIEEMPIEAPPVEHIPTPEELQQQAENTLADAERKREETLAAAHVEIAKLREEAIRQGYEEGKLQATQEVEQRFQEEKEKQQAEVLSLIRSIEREKKITLEESEDELVDLALEIAKAVIKEELQDKKDIGLQMAHEATTRLLKKKNLVVRVNSADLEMLNLHREELMLQQDLEDLRIVADSRVDQGGCIVEAEGGQVDGRIDVQFGEVTRTLNQLKKERRQTQRNNLDSSMKSPGNGFNEG